MAKKRCCLMNAQTFGGMSANTPFYNVLLGLCMLVGRYWIAVPVLMKSTLAISAGYLARRRTSPSPAWRARM